MNVDPTRQFSASHAGRFISWSRVTDSMLEGGQGQCRRFFRREKLRPASVNRPHIPWNPHTARSDKNRNRQKLAVNSQNCGDYLTSGRIRSTGDQFTTEQAQPKITR
jgi:hypothetical protein